MTHTQMGHLVVNILTLLGARSFTPKGSNNKNKLNRAKSLSDLGHTFRISITPCNLILITCFHVPLSSKTISLGATLAITVFSFPGPFSLDYPKVIIQRIAPIIQR